MDFLANVSGSRLSKLVAILVTGFLLSLLAVNSGTVLAAPSSQSGEGERHYLETAPFYEPTSEDLEAMVTAAGVDAQGIESDDFNSCELDTQRWTVLDPQNAGATFSVDGTRLNISVPPGVDYDLYRGKNHAARVTQSMTNGDFQVVAKFESDLTSEYQQQGILVEGADSSGVTILRFEFYSKNTRVGEQVITEVYALAAVYQVDKNAFVKALEEKMSVPADSDMYMRLTRTGSEWDLSYRFDDDIEDDSGWDSVRPANPELPEDTPFVKSLVASRIGVYAGSSNLVAGNEPGHNALIDFFFTTDDIIDPEDPDGYDVSISNQGDGTVDLDPSGPYECDDPIGFTAVADSGWEFVRWEGDVIGSTNPTTANFRMGMDVTAVFEESTQYTLNVTQSGQGLVTKSPNKSSYAPGEQVSVSAAPDSGWLFSGWTGDASGSTNPLVVTMDGNKSIEAVFVQDSNFVLNVSEVGQGTVTKTPDKASYAPGEQVALQAVPDSGWFFGGWSGDASGTQNPVVVTMDSNKNVVVTFTEDQTLVPVNVSIFSGGTPGDTGGSVAKDPPADAYPVGSTVALTASPTPGWAFAGWTTSPSNLIPQENRTDPEVSITIPGDQVVVLANFVEIEYVLQITPNGQGTVSIVPPAVSGTYRFGDKVTLTATPDPDWNFEGWSGYVDGLTNPVEITIEGDDPVIQISALFGRDVAEIFLPLVQIPD